MTPPACQRPTERCKAVYDYVRVGTLETYTNTVLILPQCDRPSGHEGMHRAGAVGWPSAAVLNQAKRDPHRTGWGSPKLVGGGRVIRAKDFR